VKVLHGLEALESPLTKSVLTVGNFDGMHRAHLQLLAQARLVAGHHGGPVVVLTFEPHPLTVVAPTNAPPRLSLPEEKLRCLAEAGVDITVVAKSEPALLGMEAEQFMEEVLVRRFHPTHIVEGPSFGFGRGRKGTADLLQRVAARFQCAVRIVEPFMLQLDGSDMLMVSSSLIRRLLAEGDVHRAALCLGRPYAVIGEVVKGDSRGSSLGFPTANVAVAEQLVPGDGVYAGQAVVRSETHLAAISVGWNATFGGTERRLEVHLLDFDDNLYGEGIRVQFDRRLREQHRFDSPEALADQLRRDVAAVRTGPARAQPDATCGRARVL
jgi:riboflavin kinase/FMN adenylyltransferase